MNFDYLVYEVRSRHIHNHVSGKAFGFYAWQGRDATFLQDHFFYLYAVSSPRYLSRPSQSALWAVKLDPAGELEAVHFPEVSVIQYLALLLE